MIAKLPAATILASGFTGLLCAAALIDDLGKYRWFWPYDQEVYSTALLVGLLWYVIFVPQLEAWIKDYNEKWDREDYPDEFEDR